MRKLNLASIAALFIILLSTSCTDDIESTSLTLDNFQKANVKAYVYAELDITKPGLEVVPNGTKVVLTAPYSNFNANATGVWSDTLFTDANGMVESSVNVSSKGTTYTVNPVDFESNQTQDVTASQTYVGKIFESLPQDITLLPFSEEILQFKYSAKDYENFVEFISIDLYLNGDFNETLPGNEVLPSGITITIQSTDSNWSTDINSFERTTVEGDNYSKATVIVKKGDALKILDFTYNKTLADNSQKSYLYFKSLTSYNEHGVGYRYTLSSKVNIPN